MEKEELMSNNEFLDDLTPSEEHFLKKVLLERRLDRELSLLSNPHSLRSFGSPFKTDATISEKLSKGEFPLLKFFFDNYITKFPFITNNSEKDQTVFWQETVQPFIESVTSKNLSNSNDRKENVTKRRQMNRKFTSGLLLFYNSMIITEKDLVYLETDHLKPSDVGKLDKIKAYETPMLSDVHDDELRFENGLNVNIVSVKIVNQKSGWFRNDHHYEFIIQIIHEQGVKYYVSRAYHEFKNLESELKSKFPGIMNIETGKLPAKFKHDATTLVKEKLRLSLRGYLTSLVSFKEIVDSKEFKYFISEGKFNDLTPEQQQDYEKRLDHERHILSTQFEFQKQLSNIMIDFSKRFDDFKAQLIKDPSTLTKIFQEIGSKETLDDLSPLLSIFIDWCKIELSATIFQIFLTQDNSNELLTNLSKFHRLFPYGITYNILRFTNPISIISKIINLFLITIPGTKNKSLLSMLFIMLLDEDLSGYEVEIEDVKKKLNFPNFVSAIETFIDEKLIESDLDIDENLHEIFNSIEKPTKEESQFLENPDTANLTNLKQLYQLKIRHNDKLIMKSLWQEPELTKLLKNFLIIFYQPLIKLLSKSKLHLFFRDFQHFNDELVELLVKLNDEEMYYLSSVEIFNRLMKLLDDHIIIFWRFIHNLYNNDDDQLFHKIIKWIEDFLVKLRMKYTDVDKVKVRIKCDEPLNKDIFLDQLHQIMNKTIEKRKLFKNHYQKDKKDRKENSLEDNWDKLHNLNQNDEEFGMYNEDVEEYNLELNNKDEEFQKELKKINDMVVDTSEIDKLDGTLVEELERIFRSITAPELF
ncbi:PX domain-containing protein [[Candida] jaroonii]|uniref:PX domain-containing protein n=1 Tax=[Candida] jaroonii TaxID=467808 RepID=A0ACA9YG32_9ASCO|nr:PX domain-containing protein [[Candida] jaroonii]